MGLFYEYRLDFLNFNPLMRCKIAIAVLQKQLFEILKARSYLQFIGGTHR